MSHWQPLALNPYGEQVAENASGHRRVGTTLGWVLEANLPSARACRARSASDVRLAMESLAVSVISATYHHKADRAFQIWSAPVGTPFQQHAVASSDSRQQKFRQGVERALGTAAWQALVNDRWGMPGLVSWSRVRNTSTGVATRGLQWGVAQRLTQVGAPCHRILEMGLFEAGEAASRWLPPGRRVVRARAPATDTLAPAWLPAPENWPHPPIHGAPRGIRPQDQEVETFDSVILWATSLATHVHGPVPNPWWRWFAGGGKGWVIFDQPGTSAESALRTVLAQSRVAAHRWQLREGTHERGVVWEIGLGVGQGAQVVPWEVFAPEPPRGQPATVDITVADEFGRVPYRALSKLPNVEGVAPRRMEAAMHQAFAHLTHRLGDIDQAVAEALDIPLSDLGQRLSPEQVDAVAAGLVALEDNSGFVIADETGFGKGRVMAALALIGRRRGHRVLTLTENAPLFSDGYRDLEAVAPGQVPIPFLLHQAAIVRDQEGVEIVRNVTAATMKKLLESPPGEDAPPFIMTTYAQISRKQSEAKLEWLEQWLTGAKAWVLMDEAHNAAGDSQVNARMEGLLRHAAGVIYASATFVKSESNLGLYAAALPRGRFARRLIRRVLRGDSGLLRETLTQAMARNGRLVRREHPPMAPPEIVWVPNADQVHAASEAFATAWRALGEAVDLAKPLMSDGEGVWAKLGAPLSRAVREFGLWTKIEPVANAAIAAVRAGKKPVIATDSTLEAGLRDALLALADPQAETVPTSLTEAQTVEEEDEALAQIEAVTTRRAPSRPISRGRQGAPPLWKDRLRRIVEVAVPSEVWMSLPQSDSRGQALRLKLAEVNSALDLLPSWTLSPLDALRERLTEAGVRCGELSGRKYRHELVPGGWRVLDRADPDRAAQVRAFNAGDLDALIISRAGSTGISLHAGRLFKDQRPRILMELDISPNPTHRWQFWGRVRRRDQVCEPEFLSFWLDTPSERRIVERENRKSRQLGAHMGAQRQEPIGWVSPEGEAIVIEWAAENPYPARRLGVAWPMLDEPTGRVERALARSPMLTQNERAGLIERLARGLDLAQAQAWRKRQDPLALPSRALRRLWWWGDKQASGSDGTARLNVRRVDAVERCWAPPPPPDMAQINQAIETGRQGFQGPALLARWLDNWKEEARQGQAATYGRRTAWGWAQKYLPSLRTGHAIAFASPETGSTIRGVILNVEALSTDAAALCAITPWALSQMAVRVWMVGETAPFQISLLALSQDPLFKVSESLADLNWFTAPPAPRIGVVMEGNVLAATDWGRRWGLGRSAMIWDLREGEQVVWALPSHVTFEHLNTLPRDLVDVKHAIEFFSAHRDSKLWASLPLGQTLVAQTPAGGGPIMFRFNPAAYQMAIETWLDGHTARLMGKLIEGKGFFERPVSFSSLGQLLGIMENNGIGWRVGPEHLDWYEKTSAKRLWDPSVKTGEAEKAEKPMGTKGRKGGRRGLPKIAP